MSGRSGASFRLVDSRRFECAPCCQGALLLQHVQPCPVLCVNHSGTPPIRPHRGCALRVLLLPTCTGPRCSAAGWRPRLPKDQCFVCLSRCAFPWIRAALCPEVWRLTASGSCSIPLAPRLGWRVDAVICVDVGNVALLHSTVNSDATDLWQNKTRRLAGLVLVLGLCAYAWRCRLMSRTSCRRRSRFASQAAPMTK